ncbi:MAG: universal stress protein [Terracidiphilus sp.]|nr:universal stress protein [Terracidiphilus sp.]MDR3776200.1 universal stress protein [Terracidiphilus sp.]
MNTDIRTILLATNFMQGSRRALDHAVALASKLNAKLVIVNALELGPEANTVEKVDHIPSRTRREAEAKLLEFTAGANCAGVSTESILLEGPVQKAILSAISNYKTDLLVMGTQEVHKGMGHLLLGSAVQGLMLSAPCPMLTVGPRVPSGVDLNVSIKKGVYISNLRPASAAAAPFALKLSRSLDREIEIFQIAKDLDQGDKETRLKKMVEEYCARLRLLVPEVKEEWCSTEFQMSRIISPQAALQMSMDPSIFMVLGVSDRHLWEQHLHASFAYRLLADAACPIITVCSQNAAQAPV